MKNQSQPIRNGTGMTPWPLAIMIACLPVIAWLLIAWFPDAYYISTQEDNFLEWLSFAGFLLAGLAYGLLAIRQRHERLWFAASIALFCVFVAFEEISWGQRLFGFQPPEYFLVDNFQQELNVHNVADSSLRKYALMTVLIIYGVLLPLMRIGAKGRSISKRLGIVLPPVAVALPFSVAAVFYAMYPWDQTGEWVEAMAALGFLLSSASAPVDAGIGSTAMSNPWISIAVAALASAALTWMPFLIKPDSIRIEQAQDEISALADDFRDRHIRVNCSVHKRVFTFAVEYGQEHLFQGSFAELPLEGRDKNRLLYFLDPWHNPYWLRHFCSPELGRTVLYVYSFGPNKRRDSLPGEIAGDDIGLIVDR